MPLPLYWVARACLLPYLVCSVKGKCYGTEVVMDREGRRTSDRLCTGSYAALWPEKRCGWRSGRIAATPPLSLASSISSPERKEANGSQRSSDSFKVYLASPAP